MLLWYFLNCNLHGDSWASIYGPPPLGGRYMYFGHASAKASTREWQPAGNKAVAYHIMDTSSIANVSMKNLLARVKTKDDMTAYLAEKNPH